MTTADLSSARPLGVVSSHDQIAGALARDILSGRWAPGEKLPMEAELLQRFGVSRTALREALKTISDLAGSDVTGRAIEDPDIAIRMSEVEVDIDALEMTELRVLSALQTGSDGKHFIWQADEGRARRLAVQLQQVEGDQALIRGEGLQAQLPIIVAGGSKLHEDQPIEARERN